jgi:predicted RNA binding protein YcfA (HicA-like mRNA interferase family)
VIVRSAGTIADVKYRDVLKQLKADGWEIVVIRGSHWQLKHPVKRGRVTVAGSPNDDIHPRMMKSIRLRADGEPIPEPVTSAELVAA